MTPPEPNVALELERLRGAMEVGFAQLNGRLDVSLQRTSQTEADIDQLEQRVEALERARWPLPSLAALVGLAALGLTLYEIAAR
ncbi:hypothetical protein [Streptomyces apocyni]|uniref:hypothetical protein n=1 Tax=Streptomyces apocyni TaxID=2654677 RepID=UPI0012EAA60A|nr:hypothetical protein [Streptomyces apocyni]